MIQGLEDLEQISLTAGDVRKILSDKLRRLGCSDEQIRGEITPENQIIYSKFQRAVRKIGKDYDIDLSFARDPELRTIRTVEQAANYIAKKDAEKYEEVDDIVRSFYAVYA